VLKVEKKIKRDYKLNLTEKEYYAILTLVGGVPYDDFIDLTNIRYSVRLGRSEEEKFEIISNKEWKAFYDLLDESK